MNTRLRNGNVRIIDYNNDIQISSVTGIGFGKLYEECELKGYKFKIYAIALIGVSYDYIHWEQGKEAFQNESKLSKYDNNFSKHNFGLFGVLPIGWGL